MLKSYQMMREEEISALVKQSAPALSGYIARPVASLRLANRALHNLTEKYPKLAGMGTTAAVVRYAEENNLLHIYHVGDSRVYRIRKGNIEQLTKDHSKVNELLEQGKMKEEEIKTAEIQSMITRALGTAAKVKVDHRAVAVMPDDYIIMCSDGLNTMLSDEIIKNTLINNAGSAEKAARELVNAANSAGGLDNTTVLVLHFQGTDMPAKGAGNEDGAVLTIAEETSSQVETEDRYLKKLKASLRITVPQIAVEKGIFNNPVNLAVALTLLIIGIAFLGSYMMQEKHDTQLSDLAGKISGIVLDVRIPTKTQITSFKNAEDTIQKLQLIQDWKRDKDTATTPFENVEIILEKDGEERFKGLSGLSPREVNLPRGDYTMYLKHKEYKMITDSMALADKMSVHVEPAAALKPVLIIMIPEN
jgi:protein phosphatase